jgi:antitoxin ParD1/3/4
MDSMNISLPEPLRHFVERQVASGRYSSVSEYIRELIREDERRKPDEALDASLLDDLRRDANELTADDWAAVRREVRARAAANKRVATPGVARLHAITGNGGSR